MMYRSWDTECEGQNFLSFWTIFCPFTPLTTQNIKILKKMKKTPEDIILHKCTINDNHMMYGSWDIKHDGQNFLSFWTIFCPFTPLIMWKIKILKKLKKIPQDIIIFQKCTKNHDHILHCSWDMARDRCNCFSFWVIFCSFNPLRAQKIRSFKKMKKLPEDIIILHMCINNYNQMMYGSWDMVCDRWTDRQMDRWKKWQRWVGAPPKIQHWNGENPITKQ